MAKLIVGAANLRSRMVFWKPMMFAGEMAARGLAASSPRYLTKSSITCVYFSYVPSAVVPSLLAIQLLSHSAHDWKCRASPVDCS